MHTCDRSEECTFLAIANRRDSRFETWRSFCRRIDMLGKLHRNKKNCCLKRILKQRLPVSNSIAESCRSQFPRRVTQRGSGPAAPLQGSRRGAAFGFVALRVAFWGSLPGKSLDCLWISVRNAPGWPRCPNSPGWPRCPNSPGWPRRPNSPGWPRCPNSPGWPHFDFLLNPEEYSKRVTVASKWVSRNDF